MTVSQLDTMS
uniref:Uncharacterized protein n=1 Tax=Anguilla anguilla TaxID=7936 RepID=A0A0E9UHA5_ANGAN